MEKSDFFFIPIILFGVFIRTPLFWLLNKPFANDFYRLFFIDGCPMLFGVDSWHWYKKFSLCVLGYYPVVAFIISSVLFYFGVKKLWGKAPALVALFFFCIQVDVWRSTFFGMGDTNALFLLMGCLAFLLFAYKRYFIGFIIPIVFFTSYNPFWFKSVWTYLFYANPSVQELNPYPGFWYSHLLFIPLGAILVYKAYNVERGKSVFKYLVILLLYIGMTAMCVTSYRFIIFFAVVYCVLVGLLIKEIIKGFGWDDKDLVWLNYVVPICLFLLVFLFTMGKYYPGVPFVDVPSYERLGTIEYLVSGSNALGSWSKAEVICGISNMNCITAGYPSEVDIQLEDSLRTNNESALVNLYESHDAQFLYLWEEDIHYPLVAKLWRNESENFYLWQDFSNNYYQKFKLFKLR